jgi:hypothetical protein
VRARFKFGAVVPLAVTCTDGATRAWCTFDTQSVFAVSPDEPELVPKPTTAKRKANQATRSAITYEV